MRLIRRRLPVKARSEMKWVEIKHRLCAMAVLIASISQAGEAFGDATWSVTGPMVIARLQHTATLLRSGKVLVVGGGSLGSGLEASAELYDPATGTFEPTGSLAIARLSHTATLLRSGRVLVVGGDGFDPGAGATAEIYDPETGTWTSTGVLSTSRYAHSATLLPSGRVLVAGGINEELVNSVSSAELYDEVTGRWTPTGSLANARSNHTATLLPSGRVLAAGGEGNPSLASAEIYDEKTGTWKATGGMTVGRASYTATLLRSGKVLVTGGWSGGVPSYLASAELYDEWTGSWSSTGSFATPRKAHTATQLSSGKVLVTGGYYSPDGLPPAVLPTDTELYDPETGTWTSAGSMTVGRYYHTATLLPAGQVLIAGRGGCTTDNDCESADLYNDVATPCRDVTAQVGVHTSRFLAIPFTPFRLQLAVIHNMTAESIDGPAAFVMTNLENAVFAGSSLTTRCYSSSGDPFLMVFVGSDNQLTPNEVALAFLWFFKTQPRPITYTPRVLSGVPAQ